MEIVSYGGFLRRFLAEVGIDVYYLNINDKAPVGSGGADTINFYYTASGTTLEFPHLGSTKAIIRIARFLIRYTRRRPRLDWSLRH
jgi:hypothetical protein